MIKKTTGVTFTPQEFRELNQCVCCGKADKIQYGGFCSECSKINHKYCDICEVVLRKGKYKFYNYDNRDDRKEFDIKFKAIKKIVREFVTEEERDNFGSEILCKDCIGWENRMKDICWKCDNDFTNTKENYKLNGNMCEECALLFN